MNKFQALGQELVDPVAHDGVRLASADFHEHPGPSAQGSDLARQSTRDPSVAVFVQVLQGVPPSAGLG
jgi:hypothetical protein